MTTVFWDNHGIMFIDYLKKVKQKRENITYDYICVLPCDYTVKAFIAKILLSLEKKEVDE